MPRKVVTRRWQGRAAAPGELHPELVEYLLEGRYPSHDTAPHEVVQAAFDSRRMSALWRAQRRVLLDEAKRRRITAYFAEVEDGIVPSPRFPSVLIEVDDPRCVLDPGRCHARMLVPRCEAV